ncbi:MULTISPECIES: AAA family ATPase [unclassified Streptomyces]|uniref:AAA family ATPase n=1 Tax=Streptomyces sp. TN58 TaxID=234612 RepID=UPI0004AA1CDF|nr:AAA family ATPase [Streptomyces sp. TN58]APU40327.1 ATPase [Streptomyces sp. TN58]
MNIGSEQSEHGVALVLVAGYAGSGKSEAGKMMSQATGWPLLDKDTLTRPLTESLLTHLNGDPDDRQSSVYTGTVRPLEYESLMKACWENLECGVPVVAVAPFLAEVVDEQWAARTRRHCARLGAGLEVVWVDSDASSMRERLTSRNAARDTWKLANWRQYLGAISLERRPVGDFHLVDNRITAMTPLAEQVESVAAALSVRYSESLG